MDDQSSNQTELATFNFSYDPPYDSPIEDRFAWGFAKYLRPNVTLDKQVEVETICGLFIFDFMATVGGRKIAIECDGRDYHNYDRDQWRDAILLGDRCADVIYRFRGSDIHYVPDDCVYLLSVHERQLFTDRGHINLKLLATDEIKRKAEIERDEWGRCERGESILVLRRHPTFDEDDYAEFIDDIPVMSVTRRTRKISSRRLAALYAYARKHPGMRLDTLMARWLKECKDKMGT